MPDLPIGLWLVWAVVAAGAMTAFFATALRALEERRRSLEFLGTVWSVPLVALVVATVWSADIALVDEDELHDAVDRAATLTPSPDVVAVTLLAGEELHRDIVFDRVDVSDDGGYTSRQGYDLRVGEGGPVVCLVENRTSTDAEVRLEVSRESCAER